jgi:hypothetical protein
MLTEKIAYILLFITRHVEILHLVFTFLLGEAELTGQNLKINIFCLIYVIRYIPYEASIYDVAMFFVFLVYHLFLLFCS